MDYTILSAKVRFFFYIHKYFQLNLHINEKSCTFVPINKKEMKNIKLFLTDVDGCMTDGGMYYTESGDEFKRFCVYDGMGIVLLRKAGIPCGILTSENTAIGLKRGQKLGLEYIYTSVGRVVDGVKMTKLDAANEICKELGITLEDVCFVGDDVNDLDLLQHAGIAACPANAVAVVKAVPGIIHLTKKGGDGALRELCEMILAAKNNS
jgi:YrbI family 3-deoxy-D-manno-octulosonate 8-phosphate phosphatase